jgi:hypothetical protein
VATLEASAITRRILRHIGLTTDVPPPASPRAPPTVDDWAPLNCLTDLLPVLGRTVAVGAGQGLRRPRAGCTPGGPLRNRANLRRANGGGGAGPSQREGSPLA